MTTSAEPLKCSNCGSPQKVLRAKYALGGYYESRHCEVCGAVTYILPTLDELPENPFLVGSKGSKGGPYIEQPSPFPPGLDPEDWYPGE